MIMRISDNEGSKRGLNILLFLAFDWKTQKIAASFIRCCGLTSMFASLSNIILIKYMHQLCKTPKSYPNKHILGRIFTIIELYFYDINFSQREYHENFCKPVSIM